MKQVVSLHYGKALTEGMRRDGTVPVYGTNGQTGWHDSSLGLGPTVVLGRKGMGNLGVEWCEGPFWVIDTAYHTSFKDCIDPHYFYFFVKHMGLNHLKDGTSNPGLSRDIFDRQYIPLPPIADQKLIVDVLASFDDKINLNRRMSETLEAMAWAIFKDWFINFGPTRAKTEELAPYLKQDVWSLFPDQFGGGGLPTGWREEPLDGIADFLNGLALQKHPARESTSLPVIKIAQLRSGSVEGADRASAHLPSGYVVEDGDVLFSWSGSLLHRVWSAGRGALNQHLFKVSSRCYPKWFYYYWIGHHMPAFQRIASAKATTMGHIQRHHLTEARVVVPDDQVLKAADAIIGPLFDRMLLNNVEARTLGETRDLLLPKLMSGAVGIRDAEKVLEGAA